MTGVAKPMWSPKVESSPSVTVLPCGRLHGPYATVSLVDSARERQARNPGLTDNDGLMY